MIDWSQLAGRLFWQSILDVGILTLVLFRVYLWLRGTVALQVLAGMGALVAASIAASKIGLLLTAYVLQALGAVLTLVVVVVFQEEIRRALREASPLRWLRKRREEHRQNERSRFRPLAEALTPLAEQRIGALVVVPGADAIDDYLTGGTRIDGRPSPELFEALFQESSPLHDGAVVLREGRIELAGAFLPLSTSTGLWDRYGTRHRAAVGLSERCDALVIAVSEERGEISIASGGRIATAPRAVDELAAQLEKAARGRTAAAGRAATSEISPRLARRTRVRDLVVFVSILAMVTGAWYGLAGDRSSVIARKKAVELRNVPSGRSVEVLRPDSGEISLRLKGARRLLYSHASDEVAVWVDLSGVEPGRRWLRVHSSAPPGVEVVGADPSTLVVQVRKKKK